MTFLEICKYIKKYRDLIYIGGIVILGLVISAQGSKIDKLHAEIAGQKNNEQALVEQIDTYRDDLDRANAEKHAYQLTQEELRDSIGLLKRKNYEYLTYINTHANIKDTVEVETIVIKEVPVEAKVEAGNIVFNSSNTFGKSSRTLSLTIPYSVDDSILHTGDAKLALNQDIYVEGWLERNVKTNETFVHLRSDYPGLTFNSGLGVVAESGKAYERNMRKNCGIGLAVGPTAGFVYDFANQKIIPTVGIGLTVGFTYTPKFLQW